MPLSYNYRVICDSGIVLNAKIYVVIAGLEWKWPPTRSNDLLDIQMEICGTVSPSITEDKIIWLRSSTKSFQVGATWHWIRPKKPKK